MGASRTDKSPTFFADAHLIQLAKYLRLLGFDTIFDITLSDEQIIDRAKREQRIILTRDRGILNNPNIYAGYFVKESSLREKIIDLVKKYSLGQYFKPFTRCLLCNGTLIAIERERLSEDIKEEIRQRFDLFNQCSCCKKIYWQGSHYVRMNKFIESLNR